MIVFRSSKYEVKIIDWEKENLKKKKNESLRIKSFLRRMDSGGIGW